MLKTTPEWLPGNRGREEKVESEFLDCIHDQVSIKTLFEKLSKLNTFNLHAFLITIAQ